jgi:hypothetical protein
MMNDTNADTPSGWKRPLRGWLWLVAWALLVLALSAIAWFFIGLIGHDFLKGASVSLWLPAFGLGLAAALFLRLLVWCVCSWRNFKRAVLAIACLAGLVMLFYAEEDLRGWLSWRHFKSQWVAKGEKFNFADFIPPPVPEEQNFAMAPVVASAYSRVLDPSGNQKSPPDTNVVNQLQMPLEIDNDGPPNAAGNWQKAIPINLKPWQEYYRDLALTTNAFPVAAQAQTPAADVLLALSKYDPILEQLRQAAARPASRFPLNYNQDQTFAILLPHLAPLKGCAVVLRLRALAELQAGQSKAALDDIRLALSLTEKIRSEPFLISHLVRVAMFQLTEQAVWEGLSEHRWNEAQLAELEQALDRFDFVAAYLTAMRGENVCQVATMDFLRHHPGQLDSIGDSQENRAQLADFCAYLIPAGWYYQNQLRSSKFMLEEFMPLADSTRETFSVDLANQAAQSLNAMPHTPYTVICRMLLPALTPAAHRFAFAQAALDFARLGCALERYRLAAGKYPEELDALAPQFIARVPVDPIGGQPLHYRTEPNGTFTLYSVGWNGTDDGGNVFSKKGRAVDLDKGDWVWRYPDSPKL